MTPSLSQLSVRARLTVWNIAVVALALTLFGAALRFGVRRILLATVDHDLAMRIDRDSHPGDGPGGGPRSGPGNGQDDGPDQGPPEGREAEGQDASEAQKEDFRPNRGDHGGHAGPDSGPPLGGAGLSPRNLRMAADGTLLPQSRAAYAPEGARQAAAQIGQPIYTTTTADDGETLRILSHATRQPGSAELWVTQMPAAIDFIDAADRGVSTTLLLLIPAALALTGVGGMLLTNRALRPVDDLGRLLGRIQAQNLGERLPDAGERDEFGRLSGVVNAMLARLDDAFERQRRFAADASHELRTPLATIRATSSLALDPSMDSNFTSEQYLSMLARIDTAADRATRVTQDLLFLARVGSLPIRRERLSLGGVLGEARTAVLTAARAVPSAADGRAALPEITVDVPEELRVDSDRDHLLRLFINLIDNAARHTPATGRVHVQARRSALPSPAGVTVAVIDTGEGIAPEHLAHIREPFYRPDNARSRRSGGAGLGLAITQGIVDSLHGTLDIDSVLDQGTTVTVMLPE